MNPLLQRDVLLWEQQTRNGSWQTLECHWQNQECFSRSISSVAAFSNQHNSCSLSGLSSLYFPQGTKTDSVTFQLKISCCRLFFGSVPPIHLPKSLGELPSFSPRKNENDRMFLALSVPHWCRAQWLKCSSEPKAWVWLNFKKAEHQLVWFIDPGDQVNHKGVK